MSLSWSSYTNGIGKKWAWLHTFHVGELMCKFSIFLIQQWKETLSQWWFFLSLLVPPPRELWIAETVPNNSYNELGLSLKNVQKWWKFSPEMEVLRVSLFGLLMLLLGTYSLVTDQSQGGILSLLAFRKRHLPLCLTCLGVAHFSV